MVAVSIRCLTGRYTRPLWYRAAPGVTKEQLVEVFSRNNYGYNTRTWSIYFVRLLKKREQGPALALEVTCYHI